MMSDDYDLKQAVKLIKSGQKQKGGQVLANILKTDANNERAWLWMSLAVTTKKQQRYCLNKVLEINPFNESAQKALEKLGQEPKAKVQTSIKAQQNSGFFNETSAQPSPQLPTLPTTLVKAEQGYRPPKPNFALGCVGGVLAVGLGATIWAIISVMVNYQIGWMALGVGFLVGTMVRIFGGGNDPYFGLIGGPLALGGCLIGNYLVVGVLASRGLGIPTTELLVEFAAMVELMKEYFHPMDVVFYILAVTQGFRFSFRIT